MDWVVFCIVFGILCICICIDAVCMCGLHILHCTAWYGVVLYCTYGVLRCILCHGIYMVCMNLYCVYAIACYLLDCKIPCFVCNDSWGTHGIPWVLAWYCLGWCCKVQNWMVLYQMELHVLHIMHVFHWIALVVLVWVEVFNQTSVSGINQTTGLLLLPYTSIPELQW